MNVHTQAADTAGWRESGCHGLLRLNIRTRGTAVLLHAGGVLDLNCVTGWERQLSNAAGAVRPPGPLVVDLTALGLLGCCGVPALLAARATCRDKDIPLRLVTEAGSLVARTIQITTPDGAFDVRPTMVAALAHAA
jgi:anti-sigma B factor antagonist